MATYISSSANRFYTALEGAYGDAGSIVAAKRIPAVKLAIQQQAAAGARKDKTGSRTFAGKPPGGRKRTTFDLRTYLTTWDKTGDPGYGPLFQAALGGTPLRFQGGTVASYTTDGRIAFQAPHGLTDGQGVTCGGEIRFVAAMVDATTVILNAPFATAPTAGATAGATITYLPATDLPSAAIYDYWSPETAVQRMLIGSAVDEMEILINGDYHEMRFQGVAGGLLDSATFAGGVGGLTAFPEEPTAESFDYTIVPGNMGQVWLGASPKRFCTLTGASVLLKNDLDLRSREFGCPKPKAVAAGQRTVTAAFDLYTKDDEGTQALYEAARQESPIAIMFQLGEADGQLMGVYLKSVVPDVPDFDDGENRLQWRFKSARAQGSGDDEVVVAFA